MRTPKQTTARTDAPPLTDPPSSPIPLRPETKHQKFRRLALGGPDPRGRHRRGKVDLALEAIRRVGNLGSSSYEHTDIEKEKIIAALIEAVSAVRHRLENKSKSPTQFNF